MDFLYEIERNWKTISIYNYYFTRNAEMFSCPTSRLICEIYWMRFNIDSKTVFIMQLFFGR